jgi:hypothetical protein
MIRRLLQQAGVVGAGIAVMLLVLLFLFGFNRVDEYEVGVRPFGRGRITPRARSSTHGKAAPSD